MEINLGPGELFAGPIPRCPVHKGHLRYNMVMSWYECKGWDGEGCDQRVTDEELYRDMKPLGYTAGPVVRLDAPWETP